MSKPNPAPQKSKLGWIVFLMVSAGSVLYVYTSGDDSSAPVKKTAAAPKAKNTGNNDFIPADYTYQFAEQKIQPKGDAFLPIVSKATTNKPSDEGPQELPNALTGGESWAYTGMVQVNGATQAVLENQKTQETAFVSVGQQWKKAKIKRVSDSAVDLADSTGKVYTVKMSEAASKNEAAPADANATANAPVNPQSGLNGPIGNGMDVTPLPPMQFNGGGGPGGGGWGGRGRRGGGFGRRGGGGGMFGGGGG